MNALNHRVLLPFQRGCLLDGFLVHKAPECYISSVTRNISLFLRAGYSLSKTLPATLYNFRPAKIP